MEFSNQLSAAEQERLAILAEECGEVVQAVSKILRHGYESCHPDGGPNNRLALQREVEDILTIIHAMDRDGDIAPSSNVSGRWQRKLRFTHHQEATRGMK